ncbi:hypothetical protein RI367_005355 [Sorochytrium milnesiophthora]
MAKYSAIAATALPTTKRAMSILMLLACAAPFLARADSTIFSSDVIAIDPTSLVIADNSTSVTLQIALKQAPQCDASLFLQSENAMFDNCVLNFDANSYNVSQSVMVIPKPFTPAMVDGAANSTGPLTLPMSIKYVGCAGDDNYGKEVDIPITMNPGPVGVCSVLGDPHYQMFDQQVMYHFQGQGDFYLVKSEQLTIQSRQSACFTQASCIRTLAVRYGDSVFIIDPTKNGQDALQWVAQTNGVQSSYTEANAVQSFNFALAGGSTLKLDINQPGTATAWINVYLTLASHFASQVTGLCGTFDYNPTNDFTDASGTVHDMATAYTDSTNDMFNVQPGFNQTQLAQFANSWVVPDDDNIFNCLGNCPAVQPTPLNINVHQCRFPVIPAVPPPAPAQYGADASGSAMVANGTPSVVANMFNPVFVNLIPNGYLKTLGTVFDNQPILMPPPIIMPSTPEFDVDAAAARCDDVITRKPECDPYVTVSPLVDMCQSDIKGAMGANSSFPDVVYQMYNLAYATACARGLSLRCSDPRSHIAHAARRLEAKLRFGYSPCDPNCGKCTDRGCLQCVDSTNFMVSSGVCVPNLPPLSTTDSSSTTTTADSTTTYATTTDSTTTDSTTTDSSTTGSTTYATTTDSSSTTSTTSTTDSTTTDATTTYATTTDSTTTTTESSTATTTTTTDSVNPSAPTYSVGGSVTTTTDDSSSTTTDSDSPTDAPGPYDSDNGDSGNVDGSQTTTDGATTTTKSATTTAKSTTTTTTTDSSAPSQDAGPYDPNSDNGAPAYVDDGSDNGSGNGNSTSGIDDSSNGTSTTNDSSAAYIAASNVKQSGATAIAGHAGLLVAAILMASI